MSNETISFRPTAEDLRFLQALARKTGVKSVSDILRMAIRALADERKVEVQAS